MELPNRTVPKKRAKPCERISHESRLCSSGEKFWVNEPFVLALTRRNIAVLFRTKIYFQKLPLRFDKPLRVG